MKMASNELLPIQLETAQQKLNNIYSQLYNEPQVQKEIQNLARHWEIIKENLNELLNHEGYRVIKRKSKIVSKIRPNNKTLQKFTSALSNFRKGLSVWADSVREVQKENHTVVEICREKKRERKNDIDLICVDISKSRATIISIESDIERCNNDAISYETDARQLERYAAGSRQKSEGHVKIAAVGNGAMFLFGLAFAPLTGGTSLAIATLGAGVNTAVNGTAALVNISSASSNESTACRRRQEACNLRQKIVDKGRDIIRKEQDLSDLRNREHDLETTIQAICDVENMIYILIDEVEGRLSNIQDVEMLLLDITLNGKALSIILCAFERKRKKGFFRKVFGRKPRSLDTNAECFKMNIQEGPPTDADGIIGPLRFLRISQMEVGKFLEICYLQLKEHPVEAGKIRATANEARLQHGMCSGLMKQFMTTSEFVADDMMPMMRKVIKERKSKIIIAMLDEVLKMAIDMKKEAENVKDRYEKLTSKLQENISDVNKRNKEVEKETEELTIEKEKADSLERQSRKELEEIERERREKLEEIKKLKNKRDELLSSALPSDTDDETWKTLMNMSVPTFPKDLKEVSKLNYVAAGLEFAKIPLHLIRQGMKSYGAIKGGQQAQEAIDKEEEQQSRLRDQIRERNETTLERLAQIKRFDLKIVQLGDTSRLIEALKQLAKVDEMFAEIILFWENMAVFLKRLHDKTGAGKSFLKALKTKKYAKMFEETITKAEADWRKFGAICRAYALQADKDTRQVYRFLSTAVDLMGDPERKKRIGTLTDDIGQNLLQLEY